jgi:type IV pilus assembly protein PilB
MVKNSNLRQINSAQSINANIQGSNRDSSLNSTLRRAEQGEGSIRLGQILLKHGLITQHQLQEALNIQTRANVPLGRILVRLGYVESRTIVECLSKQLKLPVIDIAGLDIPDRVIKQVSFEVAKQHLAIPIAYKDDTLIVAMADPSNSNAIEEIQFKTNLAITVYLATEESIINAFRKYYKINDKEYKELIASTFELEEDAEPKIEEVEDYGKLLSDAVDEFGVHYEEEQQKQEEIHDASGTPIIKLVQSILTKAIKVGASDIHIEPFDKMFYVRYRLDGELHKTMSLPPSIKNAITSRIKILAHMNIAERRKPQDGRIKLRLGKNKVIDLRVNALPTIFGECIVLRILDKTNLSVDLTKLGFTAEGLEKFEASITKPNGMALVTGPTGSGKTTTLYSALQKLNTSNQKILTAEDPIEYNFTGIHQVQVKEEVDLTFASCLRAFLRQDPDVIMVGEIRDLETAEIAIKAALTGHYVLSTLHTNDCPSTVGRLLDLGIKPYLIASALTIVVAQRLLRRICEKCKTPFANPDSQLLKGVKKELDQLDGMELYQGKGCEACAGTGYKGRVAVYEILVIDDDIREIVASRDFSEVSLREVAREKGMLSLRQEGLRRVREGVTTIEEVLRKTLVQWD